MNGRSICGISIWFVDSFFEASSLVFGRRHLVFLEPEVTIFGKGGDTELVGLPQSIPCFMVYFKINGTIIY